MKRICFILPLLIVALFVRGQEFKLLSLKESPNDSLLSANSCYDINGNISAILVISFSEPIEHITYRGNVLDSRSFNDSVYILYIPNATRRITLQHEDFYPFVLDLKENRVMVKGGHSYLAEIENATKKKEQQLKGSQYLTFKSEMSLKILQVNGENWLVVSNRASKLVPFGTYEYIAESKDGRRVEGSVEVKNKLSKKIVNLKFNE